MEIFVIHLIDIHLTVFSFCKHPPPPPPPSFKLMEAPEPTTKLILARQLGQGLYISYISINIYVLIPSCQTFAINLVYIVLIAVVISFVFVLVCHQQILRNITQFTLLLWRLKWTNHAPRLLWFWSHCHCDS